MRGSVEREWEWEWAVSRFASLVRWVGMRMRALGIAVVLVACGRSAAPPAGTARVDVVEGGVVDAEVEREAAALQIDVDGDDEAQEVGEGSVPAHLSLTKVGTAPIALQRICDLASFGGALYAAHAVQPLGIDGATISKYVPGEPKPFRLVFDWNRYGEPSAGGGAGQGFLRVHPIGGRLFVPDADPPYDGFGYLDHGTEGYVFASDPSGVFAKAIGEHRRPPLAPGLDGGAGAMVLPRAYHVLDVIRYRGAMYASTGSVPPKERAWSGPSPGALHRAPDGSLARLDYVVGYPADASADVWRLTFLVRFQDRLYAGIQEYYPREPNDYVVFEPPPDVKLIAPEHMRAVRAAGLGTNGGAQTLRWYADAKTHALYWIAASRAGGITLRVTHDGDSWELVSLPAGAGQPTDVVRFRDALVVLTERGLYRLDGATPIELARWDDPKVFAATDFFCVAPLAVFGGALYAGGQNGGALYRFE